jgi:hypothetical protein
MNGCLAPLPFASRREYAGRVVTDLAEIRRLGQAKEGENVAFRRYLAAHHAASGPFQILAGEIQQSIDCTGCANCCRHSVVNLSPSDIDSIARHLRVEPAHVIRHYTVPDPDAREDRLLRSTDEGCVFLRGNLCSVYPARPKACRDFPHVALGARSLGGRFSSLCRWASLCPIVYNALESYKKLVGYKFNGKH